MGFLDMKCAKCGGVTTVNPEVMVSLSTPLRCRHCSAEFKLPPRRDALGASSAPAAAPARPAPLPAAPPPPTGSAARPPVPTAPTLAPPPAGDAPIRPSGEGDAAVRTLPFAFHGSAGEYFRVWIVNVALTLATLGVYSAWAKVRTQGYFYRNTRLAGSAFDYLAKPKQILLGRMVVVGILITNGVLISIWPLAEKVTNLALMALLPLLVVRAKNFVLRNSAWRNLRFSFDGTYKQAANVFLFKAMAIPLSLGLAYPWFVWHQQRFLWGESRYANSQAEFGASLKDFYKVHLKGLGAMIVVLALIGFLTQGLAETLFDFPAQKLVPANGLTPGVMDGGGPLEPAAGPTAPFQLGDDLKQELEQGVATPGEPKPENAARIEQEEMLRIMAMAMMPLLIGLPFLILIRAYTRAHVANLVWNGLAVGPHRFLSTISPGRVVWITFSNLLAIALTCGLMIPWARVRLANYRAEHLTLLAHGDLDAFLVQEGREMGAIGDEVGEFMDLDLGL